MNYSKKISILGCGWIGQTLKDLLLSRAHEVHCLSKDIGMNTFAQLYYCDVLVIAIPPSIDEYLEVLDRTLESLDEEEHTQVIFLSSISFYDKKPLVVEAEKLVLYRCHNAVILRLGGLMGYDRIAGKHTAGKTLITDARTNYVHRDDVVSIIEHIIEHDIRHETFDVVAPLQANKIEIFTKNAKKFGFETTNFMTAKEGIGKILSPGKLCTVLGYSFIREDVREFWD